MQEMKPVKEGKVREIYDNGDSLIMVATDRISCFDVILNNEVTKKGTVLTQMSKFWFDMTQDILPNHMISVDVKDMPEFFQQEKYTGKSMMCRKLNMLPIECIVRGYITGSGWKSYQENGTVCGITLPEGLKESDKLPEPIYTPGDYCAKDWYEADPNLRRAIDFLTSEEMLKYGDEEHLKRLQNELINKDWFQTLPDFNAYIVRKEQAMSDYAVNPEAWSRRTLINIAEAGFFSSDRTIKEYDDDIWHLGK